MLNPLHTLNTTAIRPCLLLFLQCSPGSAESAQLSKVDFESIVSTDSISFKVHKVYAYGETISALILYTKQIEN